MFELCDDDFRFVILIGKQPICSFVYNGFANPFIETKELERLKKVFGNPSKHILQAYSRITNVLCRPLSLSEIKKLDTIHYRQGKFTYLSGEELETLKNKYKFGKKKFKVEKHYNMALNVNHSAFEYTEHIYDLSASNLTSLITKLGKELKLITKEKATKIHNDKKIYYKVINLDNNKEYYVA